MMEWFLDAMSQVGFSPRVEADLVIYSLEPVTGAHASVMTETGVAVEELIRWPQVPPHWIHLPSSITFAQTNSRPSPRPGWSMHSRQIVRWGRDADVAVGWAAHVRAVLGEAVS